MMSPAGLEHGAVTYRLTRLVGDFVESNDLGQVFAAETGFKVESKPDLVRAPDVSFVKKSRLSGRLPKGYFDGVPDLAIEVVSPTDKKREIAKKVNMWLVHGTISCWVVDPASMTIIVHRAVQKPIRLTVQDSLEKEPALPGFSLEVSKIFRRP
jgi:Uma2 family endonuclease